MKVLIHGNLEAQEEKLAQAAIRKAAKKHGHKGVSFTETLKDADVIYQARKLEDGSRQLKRTPF